MKRTLVIIALASVTLSNSAFSQTTEPELRVIGAAVRSGGVQDSIGSGGSEKRTIRPGRVTKPCVYS
jgi:hypothetical protein